MCRRRRIVEGLLVAWLAAAAGVPAADPPATPEAATAALARRLSSADYTQRQTAEAALLELGPAALPQLRRSITSADLEARYRLERIILSLEVRQREVAIADLEAGRPVADPRLDASWQRFAAVVGDDPGARPLFVEMARSEPWLVDGLAGPVELLRREFERRCADIHLRRIQQQESQRPVASVAALLLAANQPDCQPSATAIACLTNCVQEVAFVDLMQRPDRPVAVERLLAAWVCDPQASAAFTRLQLADRFNLIEGIDIALQMINQRVPGPQMQHAVLYLAKAGNDSHLHTLERLLDDKTELQTRRMNQGARPVATFTSRMQDVALAALLHLTDQDPATYGFAGLRDSPQSLYQPGSVGFETEAQRHEAIARWRRWSADNLKDVQPVVEQAALGYST